MHNNDIHLFVEPSPDKITDLKEDEIFVFGSNLQGLHAGGAARIAHEKFGAEWGVGCGPTGRCYAIPTMFDDVEDMRSYVDEFIEYAKQHTELDFLVTRVGCGIAGFTEEEVAPLFIKALSSRNIQLPASFYKALSLPTKCKIELTRSDICTKYYVNKNGKSLELIEAWSREREEDNIKHGTYDDIRICPIDMDYAVSCAFAAVHNEVGWSILSLDCFKDIKTWIKNAADLETAILDFCDKIGISLLYSSEAEQQSDWVTLDDLYLYLIANGKRDITEL